VRGIVVGEFWLLLRFKSSEESSYARINAW
jgi:hypothetical protein